MSRRLEEERRDEDMLHPKNRLLPPEFIQQLGEHGLFIDDKPFYGSTHSYPSGYLVFLPEGKIGNRLEKTATIFDDTNGVEARTFMPPIIIWGDGGVWNMQVHRYIPGPGPGDFSEAFDSLDGVFASILSYCFNPADSRFVAAQTGVDD